MSTASARAAPPAPPVASHTNFILGQVRSGLAHLNKTSALNDESYQRIDDILTGKIAAAKLDGATPKSSEVSHDTLGKRNAWLRETLIETSLLSDLVDTALSIGVPSAVLSSSQREAIVLLVERSQDSIAKAITNPKHQRRAQSGAVTTARGSLAGLRKGWNAAGQSVQEMAAKRQEAKERAESRKAERDEGKQMKRELKEERREFLRRRQADMLGEGSSGSMASSSMPRQEASSEPTSAPPESQAGAASSTSHTRQRSTNAPSYTSDDVMTGEGDFDEDSAGAMASVACNRLQDYGESDNAVSATTTFSPWPGLLLSSTIIAVSDEPAPDPARVTQIRYDQAYPDQSGPASRTLPPPPQRQGPTTQAPAEARQDSSNETSRLERTLRPTPSAPQQDALGPSDTSPPARPPAPPAILSTNTSSSRPPQSPFSSGTTSHIPPTTPSAPTAGSPVTQLGEVRDVTESKQKGWARKLGL